MKTGARGKPNEPIRAKPAPVPLTLKKIRIYDTVFGATILALFIGLVGGLATFGVWDVENQFINLRYGRRQEFRHWAIVVIAGCVGGVVGLIVGVFVRYNLWRVRVLELIAWCLCMIGCTVMIIGVIAVGIIGRFGDGFMDDPVPSLGDDLDLYTKKYANLTSGRWEATRNRILEMEVDNETHQTLADGLNGTNPFNVSFEEFETRYAANGTVERILSCGIDWQKAAPAIVAAKGNPCFFDFSNVSAECIGRWTLNRFRDFWCYTARTQVSEDDAEALAIRETDRDSRLSVGAVRLLGFVFLGPTAGGLIGLIFVFVYVGLAAVHGGTPQMERTLENSWRKRNEAEMAAQREKEQLRTMIQEDDEDE